VAGDFDKKPPVFLFGDCGEAELEKIRQIAENNIARYQLM
jgi:hypothetical protein